MKYLIASVALVVVLSWTIFISFKVMTGKKLYPHEYIVAGIAGGVFVAVMPKK